MKSKFPTNEALDSLSRLLIKSSAQENIVQSPSPFFMTRLRNRIQEEKRGRDNWWASDILSTGRWLLTLSTVALLFFGGSLWALTTKTQPDMKSRVSTVIESDENAVVDNLLDEPIAFADDRR